MAFFREDKKSTEDAALQKLVEAVLDTTPRGGKTRPKLRLGQRLRRWKATLRQQAKRHPFVVMCLVLGCMYPVGSNFLEQRSEDKGKIVDGVRDGGSSGSSGYSGSGPPTGNASGSYTSHRVRHPVTNLDLERRDIAMELIQSVIGGEFEERSEVATGRFLRDFENQWFLLRDVDDSLLQPARRARKWMQVRGPYNPEAGSKQHATEAIIRVVDEKDFWKLEHIRVY